jgi:hypothetical protein
MGRPGADLRQIQKTQWAGLLYITGRPFTEETEQNEKTARKAVSEIIKLYPHWNKKFRCCGFPLLLGLATLDIHVYSCSTVSMM